MGSDALPRWQTGEVDTTPSQRLWDARDDGLDGVDVRTFMPAGAGARHTLARVAERILSGATRREAVADFLDDLRWAVDQHDVRRRVEQEPAHVDRQVDAYLAALAEHLCSARRMTAPAWVLESERFLTRFWFPSNTPALDARAIVESPAAFRRRNIFIAAASLTRV